MNTIAFEFSFAITVGQLTAVTILAIVSGGLYALWLNHGGRWLADDATEISVVIGVAGTLATLFLALPYELVSLLYLLFTLTGMWQIIRSAYNRRREKEAGIQAKDEAAEAAEERMRQ